MKGFALDEILYNRLTGFIPKSIFDAHVHIYDQRIVPDAANGFSDVDTYLQTVKGMLPQLQGVRAMLIPMPTPQMSVHGNGIRELAAKYMVEQLEKYPEMVGQIYVLPGDSCHEIQFLIDHPQLVGMKCYSYSAQIPKNATISEFLPESAWIAANETSKVITLHLSHDRGMSNAEDSEYIERMAKRYPNAKLILAHCGRAFSAWTCMEPMKQLCQFDNIYFDLSAVCEAVPIYYCIKYAGANRVLWGSDFPISKFNGRAISVGDGFAWIDKKAMLSVAPAAKPMTVFEENLLAVYMAADMLELDADSVENIFRNNAEILLCNN